MPVEAACSLPGQVSLSFPEEPVVTFPDIVVLQGTAAHPLDLLLSLVRLIARLESQWAPKVKVQIMTCDKAQYSPRELHDLLIEFDRNLEDTSRSRSDRCGIKESKVVLSLEYCYRHTQERV